MSDESIYGAMSVEAKMALADRIGESLADEVEAAGGHLIDVVHVLTCLLGRAAAAEGLPPKLVAEIIQEAMGIAADEMREKQAVS